MTGSTVLIGLDGATFTVLDPLMTDGTMPFLAALVDSGVRSELRSVVPALTPPAWTSLMTGRGPGAHGVFDFFRKESPDRPEIRMLMSSDIACETIWSLASRHGTRVTVLNFPMTFPAPKVDGSLIPGWLTWRHLKLACRPAGLYDRLRAFPWFNPRELGMDMETEEKAIEGCQASEYESWIDLHISRERQWSRVLGVLAVSDPTPFTAVMFDGVDKLQHLLWRFIDRGYFNDSPSEWELRVRAKCREYFRHLDGLIAEIVERAGPDANVILASDHGFGAQSATFFVNSWLEQNGYLAWAKKAPSPSETAVLGVGEMGKQSFQLDWSETRAYATTPSSNGIHIVRASDRNPNGVHDADYRSFRDRMIGQLYQVIDPTSGEPLVTRVWTREEVFDGPFLDLAPDLTLVLRDGGLISILSSEQAVVPRAEPAGCHRPDGVFLARGPLFRRSSRIGPLSILDVTPILLYCLGHPIPAEFEGRLPEEAFDAAALASRAVIREEESDAPAAFAEPATGVPDLDPEAEEEIVRRLRALGYVN
jgi:predicted AlkP superfamily phosphohydrolase/phosphomutase